MFSESHTNLICGGCRQELTEEPENFYSCENCGVEINDREEKKVKI